MLILTYDANNEKVNETTSFETSQYKKRGKKIIIKTLI